VFHATRAVLLRELGQPAAAAREDATAFALTRNPAEKALLEERLSDRSPRRGGQPEALPPRSKNSRSALVGASAAARAYAEAASLGRPRRCSRSARVA
jgi:hypothetical protein